MGVSLTAISPPPKEWDNGYDSNFQGSPTLRLPGFLIISSKPLPDSSLGLTVRDDGMNLFSKANQSLSDPSASSRTTFRVSLFQPTRLLRPNSNSILILRRLL